jgi:hypothetical protein
MNKYCMVLEKKLSVPFFVMLISCLLIVLGALRNIVTPLGYWALWACIACIGTVNVVRAFGLPDYKIIKIMTGGFALLILGLLVAGYANQDNNSYYQGAKFFCIYCVFVIVFVNAKQVSGERILMISRLSVALAFLVFVACKFIFKDYYVVLGDGREGSQYADPGVLWRSAVFFVGFILTNGLVKGRFNAVDFAIVLMSVYILFADSSRTGFLLFSILCLILIVKKYKTTSAKVSWSFLVSVCLGLVALMGLAYLVDFAIFDRLFTVDNTRLQMLADGVSNLKGCYLFGCGFGDSSSLVFGKPMVVHNAYLAALADLGVLGFCGLVILMVAPLVIYASRRNVACQNDKNPEMSFVAMLGVAGYGLTMMLHSLSSELSEWGIWIVMVSWQFSLSAPATAFTTRKAIVE